MICYILSCLELWELMENKGVCMNIAFDLLYNVFHTYDQVDIHTNHNNPIIGQAPYDKAPSRTHFQQASAIRHRPTPFRMCDHQHCFVCLINHKLLTHTHTCSYIWSLRTAPIYTGWARNRGVRYGKSYLQFSFIRQENSQFNNLRLIWPKRMFSFEILTARVPDYRFKRKVQN